MTWNTRPTNMDAPGQVHLGVDIQAILDQIEFLTSPPIAQMRQQVGQSISNATFTALTFDTEVFDNFGGHDTATNTSRYTCQVAGYYQLSGKIAWTGNATGRRASQWFQNGTVISGSQVAHAATSASDVEHNLITMDVLLAVDDYVELMGFQDSGGSLSTIVSSAALYSVFNVRWTGTA